MARGPLTQRPPRKRAIEAAYHGYERPAKRRSGKRQQNAALRVLQVIARGAK
jgi:hypothetical protein